MKKIFLLAVILLFVLISCTKKASTSGVQVRVENNTAAALLHINTMNTDYGNLQTDAFSEYKYFDEVVAFPGANFSILGKELVHAGIGYCGTPPLPYLEEGKYTLRIFEDTSLPNGYNATYEKD